MAAWPRWPAWVGVAAVTAWLLSMTLRPGLGVKSINLVPLSEKLDAIACLVAGCGWRRIAFRYLFVDVLGNAAVFVPLGAALALAVPPSTPARLAGWRWWLFTAAAGGLLSLGIELAQITVPGRVTDVDDLILNTFGAMFGSAFVYVAYRIMKGKQT